MAEEPAGIEAARAAHDAAVTEAAKRRDAAIEAARAEFRATRTAAQEAFRAATGRGYVSPPREEKPAVSLADALRASLTAAGTTP